MCPPFSVRYLSKRAVLQPPSANMNKDYSINLSVQQVLSLWVQGTVPTLQHFTGTFTRGERSGETGSCVSSRRAHTPLHTPFSVCVCCLCRNVVLGVPVVSILLSVGSQRRGSADVCDIAAS
ncbi:hypothetical protein PO909_004107 [Leuciscus waleckii]